MGQEEWTARPFLWVLMKYARNLTIASFVLAAFLAFGRDCPAQGCAMCKTAATAQSERATKSLNRAIILLLTPPVAIMSSILLFAFRCRNVPHPTTEGDAGEKEEEVSIRSA